ncbi:proline racemase family protein [Cupriavidus sp. AcVe19-6a]|uniref:proline racemase family protein n=1 Tax=Cupriavidus sp. AcVe19-6a TaxID=2821358 RepID=UPI001AE8913A|nr:proline racemase family protein [Cupriavidus sp. AcVe19-6a]MBP0639343.1 proline racemase family protein [Cupriavidus sp. AcVe19-6a]
MKLNQVITVVGAHAEGEVGRVITGGIIAPRGSNMFERQQAFIAQQDWVRGLLLSDPRGSVNAAVNLITPPIADEADFGMIVIESDYYPPMSGSNLICTVTTALETGVVPMKEPITTLCVDTPAGLVYVDAQCKNGKCRRVSFRNVPSFVMHQQKAVDVSGLGSIVVDVAYGGMIYVIVDAQALGLTLERKEAKTLVELGERIKLAAAAQLPSVHPENPGIHTINQTLFAGPISEVDGVKTSKNAVIVSPGRLDRSPCGTGSSARLALLHAQNKLAIGEPFHHLSILNTLFECRIEGVGEVAGVPSVTPNIAGRAWLTGVSYYGVDPEDPFPEGYRLNDTWFEC